MNELMKQLPPMLNDEEIMEALKVVPEYKEELIKKDERLVALMDVYKLYMPFPATVEIYSRLYLAVLGSLEKKNTIEETRLLNDNYLKGILVQMDVTAPLFWWKQAQRYHWFDFVSSQSTMHSLLKFDVGSQCVNDTNPEVISVINKLVEAYKKLPENDPGKIAKWREIVASLPSGFCLGASMTTNYLELKTMYRQRKNHKLEEWHVFAKWCESLPRFIQFTENE